jgi:hypothetical protein
MLFSSLGCMFCNRPVRASKWLIACLVIGESQNMEVPYRCMQ